MSYSKISKRRLKIQERRKFVKTISKMIKEHNEWFSNLSEEEKQRHLQPIEPLGKLEEGRIILWRK